MTIFKKIIDRQIPADIVYETERVLVFKDIMPKAPIHLLVIPKKEMTNLLEADAETIGELFETVKVVVKEQGIAESGFRVVINTGNDGGQTVPHLHLHILGGKELSWTPG